MPGAAFSLCSPPAPPAWCCGCSSAYLVPGSCPAPPVQCRARCYRAGARPSCPLHATHLILCSPFLSVKQETLQLRPSPGSCVCSQQGLSREPRGSSLAPGRAAVIFWGIPPCCCVAQRLSAASWSCLWHSGMEFPERLWGREIQT